MWTLRSGITRRAVRAIKTKRRGLFPVDAR
jgi:hypothetical protein